MWFAKRNGLGIIQAFLDEELVQRELAGNIKNAET